MTTRITEVTARSTQGITRPFICRGDDGWLYFVKGNGAGRSSLICEWIAGHLGMRLGLPIPDFKQAVMPKELVTLSARDDIAGETGQPEIRTVFQLEVKGPANCVLDLRKRRGIKLPTAVGQFVMFRRADSLGVGRGLSIPGCAARGQAPLPAPAPPPQRRLPEPPRPHLKTGQSPRFPASRRPLRTPLGAPDRRACGPLFLPPCTRPSRGPRRSLRRDRE